MPRRNTRTAAPKTFRLVGGRVTTLTPAPAPVKSPSGSPPPVAQVGVQHSAPSAEQIRQLAYRKWEAAGSPPGDGVPFWLEAERELSGR